MSALHITELRSKLTEALTALSMTPPAYTDPQIASGYAIKRVHIAELRAAVKEERRRMSRETRSSILVLRHADEPHLFIGLGVRLIWQPDT